MKKTTKKATTLKGLKAAFPTKAEIRAETTTTETATATAEPKAAKKAKAKKGAKPAAKKQANGKGATILTLIQRERGATAAELQQATGWQPHSVRGFLSGVVGKKMSLKLASVRRDDGQRVYSAEAK